MRPVARRDGLLIRELPGEVLVYDRERHRAHCLNQTAAFVFRHADGTRTVADLARVLAPEAAPAAGASVVAMALDQLAEAGLLEDGPGEADRGLIAPRRGPPRRHRRGIPAAGGGLDRGSDPGGSGGHLRHELRWARPTARPAPASARIPAPPRASPTPARTAEAAEDPFFQRVARRLPHLHRGVAEELVDGEELGHEAGLGVGPLRGEDRVAEPLVVAADELRHHRPVELVRRPVEAQAGG